jgi:hypothetical protein
VDGRNVRNIVLMRPVNSMIELKQIIGRGTRLPGCVATGQTVEEAEQQIQAAIEFHLEGLRQDGLPIPEPQSQVEYIEVA